MINFIRGEDRHVRFRVHSAKGTDMIVESASYELKKYGEVEASGQCEIEKENTDVYLDMKLFPQSTGRYSLEITYRVADETLKHREEMSVN